MGAEEGEEIKTGKSGKHENGLCDKKMEKGQLFSFSHLVGFFSPFQHATTTTPTARAKMGDVKISTSFIILSPTMLSLLRAFSGGSSHYFSFILLA